MNGLNPKIIPHINPSKIWNAFMSFFILPSFEKDRHQDHQNGNFSVTFDLFLDHPITHGQENPTYVM